MWLTPPAPAAIAILRVPAHPALLDRALPSPGRARFARLVGPAGQVVDEVVAERIDVKTLELMVHGGPGVRAAVEACLEEHRLRTPELPLVELAQDWDDLSRAAHPAAVDLVLAGWDGPREFLFRPPVVLITGPVNAGKSTLLNAWCGRSRALVSDVPGTTRDLVTAQTLVHGWRLRLVDSAGLRQTEDALEQAGQDLVTEARRWADLVVHLRPPGDDTPSGSDDLDLVGKADLGLPPQPGVLAWSFQGVAGRSAEDLIQDLSRAVLARLGLPPSPAR